MIARRLARRDQSGFVLGVTLAAMAVGLALITALLALAFATHRAARMQQELAREQRATDGALDTALTRVRSAYSSASVTDPCTPFTTPVGSPEIGSIPFTDAGPAVNQVDVELTCAEKGDTFGDAAGDVQILGDDYTNGTLQPAAYPWVGWSWASAIGGNTAPAADLSPSLVHKGEDPLSFIGSVTAKSGAMALRTDTGSEIESAIVVDGNYKQGAAGHLGGQGGMGACGVLDPVAGFPRVAVVDEDATPECSDSGADSINVPLVNIEPPVTSPTVPANCAGKAGNVMTFAPGYYDATDVTALNLLFGGTIATCRNVIFHFQPGTPGTDYYFFDSNNAALTFNDTTAAWVFGTLSGTTPAAAKCDTAAGGTKVVFSGRTTFRHLGGNVSVCGHAGNPAIVQSSQAPVAPVLGTPSSGQDCVIFICTPHWAWVGNAIAPATGSAFTEAAINCLGGHCYRTMYVPVTAKGGRQVDNVVVTWMSKEYPPAHGSNRRMWAYLRKGGTLLCQILDVPAGRTPGFHTSVTFEPGSAACPGLPVGSSESALDGAQIQLTYMYPEGTYIGGETLRLQLWGLQMLVNADEAEFSAASSPGSGWNSPDGVLGAGNSFAASAEGDCNITQTYPTPAPSVTITALRGCWRNPSGPESAQTITVSAPDFGNEPFALRSDDLIDELFLAVDTATTSQSPCPPPISGVVQDCSTTASSTQFGAPGGQSTEKGRTEVTLEWTDGGVANTCAVPMQLSQSYTWSQRTYMIDLIPVGSTCRSQLSGRPTSVLDDLTATMAITPERGTWFSTIHGLQRVDRFEWAGLKLPDIDYMRLVATTSTVRDTTRAVITTNLASNTKFRAYGDVVMPRTSMNLNWAGTVDLDPIVRGDLVVDSIGSDTSAVGAQVGIVCCGPATEIVEIVASIDDPLTGDSVPRGVARAVVTKSTASPTFADAIITGWQLCGRGGCDLNAGSVITPPP